MFPMNRESIELGFILRGIPGYEFSMDTFNDRLRLQKVIYLLQAFGVYRGYDFSWYLRGPYSSQLTHDGFSLRETYENVPEGVRLKERKDRMRFKKFLKFMKGKTTDDLEIAASLHYLKAVREGMSDAEIMKKTSEKQKGFAPERVSTIWKEMKKSRVI